MIYKFKTGHDKNALGQNTEFTNVVYEIYSEDNGINISTYTEDYVDNDEGGSFETNFHVNNNISIETAKNLIEALKLSLEEIEQ